MHDTSLHEKPHMCALMIWHLWTIYIIEIQNGNIFHIKIQHASAYVSSLIINYAFESGT